MKFNEYEDLVLKQQVACLANKVKQFNLIPLFLDDARLIDFSSTVEQLRQLSVWALQYPSEVLQAIKEGREFCILIGFRPSRFHVGHITLAREVAWYVNHGAIPIFVVSGYEANISLSFDDVRKKVLEFWKIVTFICGQEIPFPYHVYSDGECSDLRFIEDEIGECISIQKILQLYGWESDIPVATLRVAIGNAAIFLFPQIIFPGMPVLILSDINQATHAELAKIVARKLGLATPAFSYRILLQSFSGPKQRMSIRDENSVVFLDENPCQVSDKLHKCFSGGRLTVEEQKEKGGDPLICSFLKICSLLLPRKDTFVMLNNCTSGCVLCKHCKLKYTELFVSCLSQLINQ